VKKIRPGRTLAASLPESPPRWVEFLLWLILVGACLSWFGRFIVALSTNTVAKNSGLLECIAGLLGLCLLIRLVRVTVLQILAGVPVVEVSAQPARSGQRLEYLIESGRPVEAVLLCRRPYGRRSVETVVNLPLESGGVKSLMVPVIPENTTMRTLGPGQWSIQLKIRFGPKLVLEQEHPIEVESELPAGGGPSPA